MMNPRWLISVFAVSILFPSCYDSAVRRPSEVSVNRQPVLAPQKSNPIESLENIFTPEPSLTYYGYTVTIQTKNVDVEGIRTEESYAVLRKGRTTVAIFDGLYHPAGNNTRFGLFSFLGGEPKLVVEQSTPRNWSHSIVQLVPDFRVIFNSRIWSVDGELIPVDANHDGIFEFTKTLTVFYDFHKLPTSDSPLIPIVFRHDYDSGKYVPANHVFQDYSLKGIDDEVKSLNRSTAQTHLAGVLHVLLRYIYAGKEEQGWAFFEREYNGPDKDLIKSDIVLKLSSEPVYKFVYRQ